MSSAGPRHTSERGVLGTFKTHSPQHAASVRLAGFTRCLLASITRRWQPTRPFQNRSRQSPRTLPPHRRLRKDRSWLGQLSSMVASRLSAIDPLRNARDLVILQTSEQQDWVLLQESHLPMFGPEKPLGHEYVQKLE